MNEAEAGPVVCGFVAHASFNGAASMNEAEDDAPDEGPAEDLKALQWGRLDERGGGPTNSSPSTSPARFNGAASMNEAEGDAAAIAELKRQLLQWGRLDERGGGCTGYSYDLDLAALQWGRLDERGGGVDPGPPAVTRAASMGPPR